MASPLPRVAFAVLASGLATLAVDAGARETRLCASREAPTAGASSAPEDAPRSRGAAACDATILLSTEAPPSAELEAGPRSAYVVIFRPRRLRQLAIAGADPHLRPLRFGVALVDAPASRLPAHGLARHGIFGGATGRAMLGAHRRGPAPGLASAAGSDPALSPQRRSRPTRDSDRSDGPGAREPRM